MIAYLPTLCVVLTLAWALLRRKPSQPPKIDITAALRRVEQGQGRCQVCGGRWRCDAGLHS